MNQLKLPPLAFWRTLVLCLAAATLAFSRWQPIYWEDTWIHLGVGNYMLSHRLIPRADIFTWTAVGARWVNTDWLYEIVLAGVVRVFGLFGASLLKNGLVLASVFFVDKRLRLWNAGVLERVLFNGLVFLGGWPFWVERADLSSLLFFSVLFWAIDRSFATGGWKKRQGFFWAAAFVVWGNLHGEFTLGLFVLAVYAGSVGFTDRRQALSILLGTGLCAAATLINPNGLDLYRGIFRVMKIPVQDVYEWLPPRGLGYLFFYVSSALAGLSLFLRRRLTSQTLFSALVILLFAFFSFKHQRFIHFFMVGAFPYAACYWLDSRTRTGLVARMARHERAFLVPAALFLFWTSVVAATHVRGGIDAISSGYAKGVCDFIESQNIQGRFYNEYKHGAYWLYRFQGHPAHFQDGRHSVVEGFERTMYEARDARRTPAAWIRFLDQYRITAAAVKHPDLPPERHPALLNAYFPPAVWALVYRDEQCYLFLRRRSGSDAVIKRWERQRTYGFDEGLAFLSGDGKNV